MDPRVICSITRGRCLNYWWAENDHLSGCRWCKESVLGCRHISVLDEYLLMGRLWKGSYAILFEAAAWTICCLKVMCNYSHVFHWALVLHVQYIPRNMHTVFALLCFVVVIHWLIFPYPSGLLHWHCGNLTIAPVPAKQPWWIWINTSCEFIMNDCITTTKQSTTKLCAYFLGYTVCIS